MSGEQRETIGSLQVPTSTWNVLDDDARQAIVAAVPTKVRAVRRLLSGVRRVRRIDDAQQTRIERLAEQAASAAADRPSLPLHQQSESDKT